MNLIFTVKMVWCSLSQVKLSFRSYNCAYLCSEHTCVLMCASVHVLCECDSPAQSQGHATRQQEPHLWPTGNVRCHVHILYTITQLHHAFVSVCLDAFTWKKQTL